MKLGKYAISFISSAKQMSRLSIFRSSTPSLSSILPIKNLVSDFKMENFLSQMQNTIKLPDLIYPVYLQKRNKKGHISTGFNSICSSTIDCSKIFLTLSYVFVRSLGLVYRESNNKNHENTGTNFQNLMHNRSILFL